MKLDGQQPQMNIDIMKDTKPIVCGAKRVDLEKGVEIVCDGESFDQAIELRKVSALVSPTGKEAIVPIQVFACGNCGTIPKNMMSQIQQGE